MKLKLLLIVVAVVIFTSCVSTKSTLKNVDDSAPIPKLTTENYFVLTEYSKDPRYGYDSDYPINVYYKNSKEETKNSQRFLGALTGPNGEKIYFKKVETCCPFPTKRSEMGAGFLEIYEITWVGQKKPIRLYINIFERGWLQVPIGFELRKTH